MFNNKTLQEFDSEIFNLISQEAKRQEEHIELIASENYTSTAIMQAQGTVLTNKYAEGYPSKRYYGGCEFVDGIESIAIERACKLFGADYANVQPHSGSQANAAVYMALLNPGDTVLGMSLAHGGHLTHGSKVSFSGKIYNSVQYTINSEGLIDFVELEKLALEHKPKMIIAGYSAYSRPLDLAKFKEISSKVNAYLFVDMAHFAGLVAAGLLENPIKYADVVTSTTHKTLRGPRGGLILAKQNDEIIKKLNSAVFPGLQGGPLEHVIAAKAICFKEAMDATFVEYQTQVIKNAKAMAKVFIDKGFDIVSGGTDNHLFLVSLIKQNITGKDADNALGRANITVNKNSVPNDPQSPFVTSGIRVGTPAITTRGFKESECETLATWMCEILKDMNNEALLQKIQQQVKEMCKKFPVYKQV